MSTARDYPRLALLPILGLALAAAPAMAGWPLGIGGSLADQVTDMVTTAGGDTYVAGYFEGTLALGETALASEGGIDGFVAKLNRQGGVVWAKSFGGASADKVLALAVSPSENVYLTGVFYGRSRFGGQLATGDELEECDPNTDAMDADFQCAADGFGDVFVVKFRSDGEFAWVRRAGWYGRDEGHALAVREGDSSVLPVVPELVIVGGLYQCNLLFYQPDNSGTEVRSTSLQFNPKDTYPPTPYTYEYKFLGLWGDFRVHPDPPPSYQFVPRTDAQCQGTADGLRSPWVAALDADGRWRWAFQLAGIGDSGSGSVEHLVVDSAGQIFAHGELRTALRFTTSSGDQNLPAPPVPVTPFVSETIPVGGPFPWFLTRSSARSGQQSYKGPGPPDTRSHVLAMTEDVVVVGTDNPRLEFWHTFQFEPSGSRCYDGGVLEVSTNSGGTWQEVTASRPASFPAGFTTGGYNATNVGTNAYPPTLPMWCNFSPNYPGFSRVEVDLSPWNGSSVRFRWRVYTDFSIASQGWWVDDVTIRDDGGILFGVEDFEPSPGDFVAKVELQNPPTDVPDDWVWAKKIPDPVTVHQMSLDPNSGHLLLAGTKDGSATASFPLEGGSQDFFDVSRTGALVATLKDDPSNPLYQWARLTVGGDGRAATVDDGGGDPTATHVYLAGEFSGEIRRESGAPALTSEGGSVDVFVAKLEANGDWSTDPAAEGWNGRSLVRGGGGGTEKVSAVSFRQKLVLDPDIDESHLIVAGTFDGTAVFGDGDNAELPAVDAEDGFAANLGLDGEWLRIETETWLVGEPITPPSGAFVADLVKGLPEIFLDGVQQTGALESLFLWRPPITGDPDGRLYPATAPVDVNAVFELRWRVPKPNGDPPDPQDEARIVTTGRIVWPEVPCSDAVTMDCYQAHHAGAPVQILPAPGGPLRAFVRLAKPALSDAAVDNNTFTATASGFSTVIYAESSEPDPTRNEVDFEVVRTIAFGDAAAFPFITRGADCEIGSPIVPPAGTQVGRTGWTLNSNPARERNVDEGGQENPLPPLSFYDSDPQVYDRGARTGTIIAVNQKNDARPTQDAGKALRVAWYRVNHIGVAWPETAVEYDCQWPVLTDRIIVASQQGSEVLGQTPLDPLAFPALRIYVQNDPSLSGFNPNDEHALMAPSSTGSGFPALFALRSDFGGTISASAASEPYVLAKYRDPDSQAWRFKIYQVLGTGAGFDSFRFCDSPEEPCFAGTTVNPPYPLRLQEPCDESSVVGQGATDPQPPPPFFQDTNGQLWAKSAGTGKVLYYYPLQPGWFYDLNNDDLVDAEFPDCVPFLARLPEADGGTLDPTVPIEVSYDIRWPDNLPLLTVGETLLKPKRGLPEIFNQAAVKVVFDEYQEACLADDEASRPEPCRANPLAPENTLVQLIDPLSPRTACATAPVAGACPAGTDIPSGDLATDLDEQGLTVITGNAAGDVRLPFALHSRLRYSPLTNKYTFSGLFDESGAGEPLLLLNVMSIAERDLLLSLSNNPDWTRAIEELFSLSRNPPQTVDATTGLRRQINQICTLSADRPEGQTCLASRAVDPEQDVLIGFADADDNGILEPFGAEGVNAGLTAGAAQGTGYVTLAFNDSTSLALPVSLEVIRVDCLVSPPPPEDAVLVSPYIGQINVIEPANLFDEQLTLRHSGDFGGRAENLEFEWFRHPDVDGTPPMPVPDPETGQLHGWQQVPTDPQGAVQITLGGANIQTLSDNWYVARYRGLPACENDTRFSVFAGQPGSTPLDPRAQLGLGWVKRVIDRLNPFDARVTAFHTSPTNTFASMIAQLGERFEGPIALSDNPDNLNEIGLIEAYETVLRRAMQLSVDGTPPVDYEPANAAILNITSRISDFYMLLCNESFADAQDPTIGISTDEVQFGFGTLAPTIFSFQNQLASLLEEELVLLRGRDDSQGPVAAPPVYNRLFWNFTQGTGEVAYVLSYNISDQDVSGVIDETDARILYPQGHGDAWGHCLTAMKVYHRLLRHPFYSWNPRPEAVPVAGVPLQVDFLDERKFARAAAQRAKSGAEIVDLTYRLNYVEDPAGQWQGYKDTDEERAWGLAEWGRRAGTGAYLDWVVGNAILPDEDPDPSHVGIQKIDRTTVDELHEIVAAYDAVQDQVDEADRGLNPLGLAKGVVPFDIDPARIDAGETHFEQIFERAAEAVDNAVAVWDFANQLNRMLRRNQDEVDDLTENANGQEHDFKGRMIEVFGRPYEDDVGAGGTYPNGYDGPDLYHYSYVDAPALSGTPFDVDPLTGQPDPDNPKQFGKIGSFTATYEPLGGLNSFFDCGEDATGTCTRDPFEGGQNLDCGGNPLGEGCTLGPTPDTHLDVDEFSWQLPNVAAFARIKPPSWTGVRPAAGSIQDALCEILNAQISLRQALEEYEKLRMDIECTRGTLEATFNVQAEKIRVMNAERKELNQLIIATETMRNSAIGVRAAGNVTAKLTEAVSECLPEETATAGLSVSLGDVFAPMRCSIKSVGIAWSAVLDTAADALDIAANATEAAKEDVSLQAAIEIEVQDARLEQFGLTGEIAELVRQEPVLRTEIFARAQMVEQSKQNYRNALAGGLRIFQELVTFRKNTAAAVQEYRHEDMAFRIFRNDALQKYRATFDMAARYAYLAATAYDYDTNLLGTDGQAGQDFLVDIVRQRSLGQILNGEPVPGSPGLADPLGRMELNFQVLKGQMGFNNPQVETNRFSLRREFFRLTGEATSDEEWRQVLEQHRVSNLFDVPEFQRFARPFAPESLGAQPGIVIPFSTTVTFALNYFGWPLGPGDSAYDPSQFSTRVRGSGVWFGDYGRLPLSNTPRVYLIPAGADVLRPPTAGDFTTREWSVVDQLIPVPFPIGGNDLEDPEWAPLTDMLSGNFGEIRRFGSFRAYDFTEPFDNSQIDGDSRLIGRSVWNTRWLLVIPGGTFLADPGEGLETFIHGQPIGDGGERDEMGITDILIFFKTYAYQGF